MLELDSYLIWYACDVISSSKIVFILYGGQHFNLQKYNQQNVKFSKFSHKVCPVNEAVM